MILADNRATVFLDGIQQVITPSIGFTTPTSFGFSPPPGTGVHTLRVDVVNDLYLNQNVQTPTGMDLSGTLNGSVRFVPCPCVGDCDGSGDVTVNEILTLVNIALGDADVSSCVAGDANHDGKITVDEILTAVNNALNGCSG